MADAEVRGLDDLVHVAKALKDAGEAGKGLRKELYAGLSRAAKPMRADLNESVPASFPSGGGLAARMAKSAKFSVRTRTSQRSAGVALIARGKGRRTLKDASQRGTVSHPVFGNRKVWVTQSAGVTPGQPPEAFERDKPVVKREVLRAIADVKNKINRSI